MSSSSSCFFWRWKFAADASVASTLQWGTVTEACPCWPPPRARRCSAAWSLALRDAQGARVPRPLWRPGLQAAAAARAGRPRAGPGRGAGAAAAAPAARRRAAAVHAAVLAGAAGAPGSGRTAPCTPANVIGMESACLGAGTVYFAYLVGEPRRVGRGVSRGAGVLPAAGCCAAHQRAAARPCRGLRSPVACSGPRRRGCAGAAARARARARAQLRACTAADRRAARGPGRSSAWTGRASGGTRSGPRGTTCPSTSRTRAPSGAATRQAAAIGARAPPPPPPPPRARARARVTGGAAR